MYVFVVGRRGAGAGDVTNAYPYIGTDDSSRYYRSRLFRAEGGESVGVVAAMYVLAGHGRWGPAATWFMYESGVRC